QQIHHGNKPIPHCDRSPCRATMAKTDYVRRLLLLRIKESNLRQTFLQNSQATIARPPPPPPPSRRCHEGGSRPERLHFIARIGGTTARVSQSQTGATAYAHYQIGAPYAPNTYLFVIQARTSEVHRSLGNFYAQVIRVGMRAPNSSLNDTESTAYRINSSDYQMEMTTYLPAGFTYRPDHICPERLPSMKGEMEVNMSEVSMGEVSRQLARDMHIEPGGFWRPSDCQPRWKVAILIPFRNRHEHLPILLRHLLPILHRQRLEFGIFVVEQAGSRLFNRAMLFNAGFMAALRSYSWDCFVFHDVDHVPENDRNYYGCSAMPRHFAVKLDKYAYKFRTLSCTNHGD
ncbi:beta-1,4-galactosyltransferase 5-like, partial [Callorhinchus milii]|uniref:beta-1,4-galactosyltransferase 5-like n=1 Tax=Callorhinchus milii TaxID=7868 RepID=UPI001C3FE0DC